MKKITFILLYLLSAFSLWSQCPSEEYVEKCEKRSKINPVIQSFLIDIKSKKEAKDEANHKYELFFSKGQSYEFSIFSPPEYEDELTISLFDEQDNLIISSYNENTDSSRKKFKYNCKATGTYTLVYYPDKSLYCGVVVLSSVKNTATAKNVTK